MAIELSEHLEALAADVEDQRSRRLIREMLTSVRALARDDADTLDLKIINSTLKELREAFQVFRPYRSVRKAAIFGSTRMPPHDPLYQMAVELGRLMVEAGWMIITGGASGIMRAGHEKAGRAASFGLNIRLPFEQEANPIIAGDPKLITFKYFFTRKLLFIKESHATVLFPGGFGTMDEGLESLTLVQTGKSEPRPILLVDEPGARYWKRFLQFFESQMVHRGMVSPDDRTLFTLVTSTEAARDELLRFYSTYHSSRYVGDRLILRLTRPLSEEAIQALNREFTDILDRGTIEPTPPLQEELEDEDELDWPRLALPFNRRDFGRLRQLIDRINELGKVA